MRIRAITSALEKGEHSRIATAYTDELEALQKGNTGATAVHKDNSAGKRAGEAERAYRKAKKGDGDLDEATNTLSNALDKMLVEAANRATWAQRRTSRRKAAWSPKMATHSAALIFLKQSSKWTMLRLKRNLARLPPVQQALMPPWDENMLEMTHQLAQAAWEKEAEEAKKRIRKELGEATK